MVITNAINNDVYSPIITVSQDSYQLDNNKIYICNHANSIDFTLPVLASLGSFFIIIRTNNQGFVVRQNDNQFITFPKNSSPYFQSSTVGIAGFCQSNIATFYYVYKFINIQKDIRWLLFTQAKNTNGPLLVRG